MWRFQCREGISRASARLYENTISRGLSKLQAKSKIYLKKNKKRWNYVLEVCISLSVRVFTMLMGEGEPAALSLRSFTQHQKGDSPDYKWGGKRKLRCAKGASLVEITLHFSFSFLFGGARFCDMLEVSLSRVTCYVDGVLMMVQRAPQLNRDLRTASVVNRNNEVDLSFP